MYEMSSDTAKAERLREKAERAREKTARAEARVRERSEHSQEQVDRALERVADAEDRAGEKVARALHKVERVKGEGSPAGERSAGERSTGESEVEPMVWLREEPTSRRPAHSRADIARAAAEIADSDGFEAVSMRRVAQRLGAGTMTLYHYVRNKDELITLMGDQVMAEIVVPDGELSDHWREAITQIAIRTRNAFAAHRWIFERLGDGRPGPSGLRHFEQTLQAVAPLGLDKEQTFELVGQIDDYVFGYALREVQEREEHQRGWPPEVFDFFKRELETGEYPLIAKFFDGDIDGSFNAVVDFLNQPGRFERGLNRLLDGIEAEFAPKSRK
jgi:AcrR family transcriptional regulator